MINPKASAVATPAASARWPTGHPQGRGLSIRPLPARRTAVPATTPDIANSSAPGRPLSEYTDFETLQTDIITPGGPLADKTYQDWLARKNGNRVYGYVQNLVHGHRHEALFRVTLEDVEALCNGPTKTCTQHALGDIDAYEALDDVENYRTPYAIEFLMHYFLETQGRLFTWQEFCAWFKDPRRGGPAYFAPFRAAFVDPITGRLPDRYARALQWRVGSTYYSFVREIHLLASLRQVHGLDVRYHMLADALYRVDFWIGDLLINVYVENQKYRDGDQGRKRRSDSFLDMGGFRSIDVGLERRFVYGKPWLVKEDTIAKLAKDIHRKVG